MSSLLFAFTVTLFAGLATGIGSLIAFFARQTNTRFLALATGFSAGVMLYVSFVEILHKGLVALVEVYGDKAGAWINAASFFGGILLMAVIDALIPGAENPHEQHSRSELAPIRDPSAPCPDFDTPPQHPEPGYHDHGSRHKKLLRMGLFTALAIGIHNFPEGLATFLAALEEPTLGLAIAIAIALHNIPEGISVSVPIFYATGNRRVAFRYSLLSGFAEPVGALVGYGLLRLAFLFSSHQGAIPSQAMGILFGGVAGVMVYISLDELLPTSRAYGRGHDSLIGLLSGMIIMALSLLLMR